jgi:hypothetical protein
MVPHHQPDDISQTKIQVSSTVPLNHNLPWWGQSDVIVAATAFQPRPVLQTLRAFPLTPWQWRNPDSTKVPKARFILGMDWIIDNYHIYLRLNGWMIFYNLHLPMISNWINWLIPNSAFFLGVTYMNLGWVHRMFANFPGLCGSILWSFMSIPKS